MVLFSVDSKATMACGVMLSIMLPTTVEASSFTIPGDPTDTIALTVSYIGLVAAFLMFLSPLPTMHRIIKEKDITFFSENACLVTGCGCVLWTAYAIATPDRMSPLLTNLIGFIIQGSYCLIFLFYANESSKQRVRCRMGGGYSAVTIIVIFAFTCLQKNSDKMIPDITKSGDSQQTIFLGLVASAFNIGVYAAPLSVMRRVIETQNAEFMPLPLTLMSTFASFVWSFYGLYANDIFIAIPNYIGLVLSIAQLSLIAKYRSSSLPKKSGVVTSVEMSKSNDINEEEGAVLVETTSDTPEMLDMPSDSITIVVEKIMEAMEIPHSPFASPLVMAGAAAETIMETLRDLELPPHPSSMSETVEMIKENIISASPLQRASSHPNAAPEYHEL